MTSKTFLRFVAVTLLSVLHSSAQEITINGVTERGVYDDTVTFNILAQSGYTYAAWLTTNPIPAGQVITIDRPDFYQLYVERTEIATGQVVSRLVQFIVEASERAGTELGLPRQTPFPVIQSSSNEFAGAHLRIIAPQNFPMGYRIPIVAWVENEAGHAVRANGLLVAPGHPSIQLRRGVGSGFLSAGTATGPLNYASRLHGLENNKVIEIESNVIWTAVSGVLDGTISWPDNSRVHVTTNTTIAAGATLAIGAGTIVRVSGRVNITNNGTITINGTTEQPVVFMPNNAAEPWGGFVQHANNAQFVATGAIFTGSGAEPCWYLGHGCSTSLSGIGSHRGEQSLISLVGANCNVTLTDCAAIDLAGQLGHSVGSAGTSYRITLTRFLMQRTTTGGEFTRATFAVNDSAFIECPEDTPLFEDGDNDALYLVGGTHGFTNTLIGWTKDDGIDSGGTDNATTGFGKLDYESCWFEAIFHEGNSLSGYKNTFARNTVYLDCGQGIEDGYNAPTGRVDHCLFVANRAGVRHGDNYTGGNGSYNGRISATNCLLLNNHRDVFGYNWHSSGGWTNAGGQMFIDNNLLTVPDTNFPNNAVWDPATDAWRLGPFGGGGHVGVAVATRADQTTPASLVDGLPVALSTFCTNEVVVVYDVEATDGITLTDTLRFRPGEVRKFIPLPTFAGVLRVVLSSPQNADLTGPGEVFFQNLPPLAPTLVARRSVWRYLDTATNEPAGWESSAFDDSTWPSGLGTFGYGDGAEGTFLLPTTSPPNPLTYYFRTKFSLADTSTVGSLAFTVRRDDGVVVYLNGTELFRMNMPLTSISYGTFASGSTSSETTYFPTNVSASALRNGGNVLAVELHQQGATSSDAHFDLDLQAQPPPGGARVNITTLTGQPVVYWNDPSYSLEQAPEVTGTWTNAASNSPVPVEVSDPRRFYRLKKP